MAKKTAKRSSVINIDWYLISVDRLKQIGLVVLLLLLGGAGFWYWHNQKANPKSNAESAIADARQALNAFAASPEFNAHRNEFARAQQKLDEANAHFTASRFAEAQGAAIESQTISRTARSAGAESENDAQFLTVEGDVKFQKASSSDWNDAEPRTPLFNGDWVKTGDRASAELIFSNGSLYTVGANALLEIYAGVNPGTTKKTNAVKMRVGSVEVATSDDPSTVRTPGTQVVVESDSSTQVGVDRTQATSVVSVRGQAAVTPEAGGTSVRLAAGEKVNSTPVGAISEVSKFAQPPALVGPGDNQTFQLGPGLKVEFTWEPQSGATGYLLQVSRSRLFATQEINSRRQKTTASARVTSEGAFYWRVASVGADGTPGPFSTFRRFRVSGGGKSSSTDTTPPVLHLKAPFKLGGQFYMIAGSTEPGATIFINDEEVDVESNGSFQKLVSFNKIGRNAVVVKAVDPAGNQTVQSQSVLVEE
ncbi:MAG: FecR domain-containing protein [Acidobacteria bacterium]|nr:FecR domain-containing protein [Acidobacteriota bacterium]MBV9476233.1 FecR domain-containing protein [Acidobacteriota bacterium]